MKPVYFHELNEARRIVRAAWHLIKPYYGGRYEIHQKADGPVTTADHAANQYIVGELKASFPDDAVLSEEGVPAEGTPADGERLWIVDPIDGTNDFIHGTGNFAIQVGMATLGPEGYRPRLGVVYHAVADEMFYASEGSGAHLQRAGLHGLPLFVSEMKDIQHGTVVMTRNHRTQRFLKMMEHLGPSRSITMGSMGLKIIWVAIGRADYYLNNARNMCKEWDVCAPEIILREAGGMLTDLETGGLICYNKSEATVPRGILATNGNDHEKLREAILSAERWVRGAAADKEK